MVKLFPRKPSRNQILYEMELRKTLLNRIMELAEADEVALNRDNTRILLNNYSIEDIERAVDAFERFGVRTIIDSVTGYAREEMRKEMEESNND